MDLVKILRKEGFLSSRWILKIWMLTPNLDPLKDGDKCLVFLIMKFNYGITTMQILELFRKLFQRLTGL